MEQQDDKLIPYLLELENEIEADSKKLTPKYIRQTRQRLHSIALQLDGFHNSKLGISKLIPDILYTIFKLAVYESCSPATTIIRISSVCRHWRKFALGWPALWGFLDMKKNSSFLDPLVERSQNLPLSLSWTEPKSDCITDLAFSPPYFPSYAKFILPRLCSLTIHVPYPCFSLFHRDIQKNGSLLPIRLQYLDIRLFIDSRPPNDGDTEIPPPLTHLIDNSCLQKIKLSGLDYYLDLPHRNLTSLSVRSPIEPPTVPRLLVFLSNCPLLNILELEIRDYPEYCVQTYFTKLTSPSTVNELVLNLTTLKLGALGMRSYKYVRQFSRCIRISPGALSQLQVTCESTDNNGYADSHHPLAVVPPGIFSNFSNCQYLDITLFDSKESDFQESEECLQISGHTSASDIHELSPLLSIMCTGLKPIDCSPILELVHAMPQICHLTLRGRGWEIFTLWSNLEIRSAFPHLHTLELMQCDIKPISLPTSLQLKKLILGWCYTPGDVLFDMVSNMGIGSLEMLDCWDTGKCTLDVASLREMGVDVVVRTSVE